MEFLKNFIISVSIMLLLIYIYQGYISPLYDKNILSFGKYGYPLGKLDWLKLSFCFFILLIISTLLPTFIKKPSDLIIGIYYYLVTIPYCSLYSLNLFNSFGGLLGVISFLFLFSSYKIFFIKKESKLLYFIFLKKRGLIINYSLLISFLIVFFLIYKFGFKTKIDSILNVYNQRKIFNNSGILVQIAFSFLSFGFIPYFIFLYFDSKKFIYLILVTFFSLVDFMYSGSKMILFGVFFTFIIGVFMRKKDLKISTVGLFIIFLILVSIFMYLFLNKDIFLSLFVRRSMILIAQIYGLYFEYFTEYPYNFLAKYTHLLGINNYYSQSAAHIIGETYFLENTHANSGIISDAYGNFGIIGVIFYIAFLFTIFYFLNYLNKFYKKYITFLIFPLAISLTNSSVLAVFIYQIIPFLIVFYLLRKENLK